MRLVTSFYRRGILMVRELAGEEAAAPNASARLAPLLPADFEAYRRFRPRTERAHLEARYGKGHEAVAAWVDERIVHAAWVAMGRGPVPYLGGELVLRPDELLVYDSFTLPAFRGRGISRARMSYVFGRYRERGYRRCLAVVALENRRGRRALDAGGYQSAGRYSCIRVGPWYWCWNAHSGHTRLPELARPGSD